MNIEEYFSAPVYPSRKSSYTIRRLNDEVGKLADALERDDAVADYFQPLMAVQVRLGGQDYWIDIDFWVEYADGRPADLLHIVREGCPCLEQAGPVWMRLDDMLGLVLLEGDRFERLEVGCLRYSFGAGAAAPGRSAG